MFSFSTENVQSKNMYKIFTRKEKNEKVSYINYIMNKGVVLYSGNSLQTMHSLGGGGGGGCNNGDCTGNCTSD